MSNGYFKETPFGIKKFIFNNGKHDKHNNILFVKIKSQLCQINI
jgi:hypothetical protein